MIYSINLKQFRNYTDAVFEFNSSVTIVVGPNGSGKTNLLEAVLVLARGKSYRAHDADLVQFAAPWARLDGHTDNGERVVKLTPDEPVKKTFEINDKSYQRLPVNRTLPVVLFEPNHLRMLSGGPQRRRDYLDELLNQVEPGYAGELRQYKKALAQRNALLKQTNRSISQQIFPWNVRLSQLAGSLVRSRLALVEQLAGSLDGLYKALAASPVKIDVQYQSNCQLANYESNLLHKLDSQLALDQARGFTGSGPHRDDLAISYDGRPLALVASRGETRTAVLALKILELKIIEDVREQKPLLLLDDVFSELDGARRQHLTEYLADYQTLITTTDADVALHNFGASCTVIPLKTN